MRVCAKCSGDTFADSGGQGMAMCIDCGHYQQPPGQLNGCLYCDSKKPHHIKRGGVVCDNCQHFTPSDDYFALTRLKAHRVAIVAPNGSGKTYLANRLVSAYGYTRLSLAYEVRAECARRWPDVDWWTQDKDTPRAALGGRSVRQVLIDVGTHEVRASDPDFWVRRLGETIERTQGPLVVDDVRFVNEMLDLKAHGFWLVCVIRPGYWNPAEADAALVELYGHALNEAQAVVLNTGDARGVTAFLKALL